MLCARVLSFPESPFSLKCCTFAQRLHCIAHVYSDLFLFFPSLFFSFFCVPEKSALTSSDGRKEENMPYFSGVFHTVQARKNYQEKSVNETPILMQSVLKK